MSYCLFIINYSWYINERVYQRIPDVIEYARPKVNRSNMAIDSNLLRS